MTVVLMSLWRNDARRKLEGRMRDLLSKQGVTRWVWVVGDSEDDTEKLLRATAWVSGQDVEVVRRDTGIVEDDPDNRLLRLSLTANAGFETVRADDRWWCIHESDLQSPQDVIWQLLGTNKECIAGWVTLGHIFYDTYAYRAKGTMFSNNPPYHEVYDARNLFEVESVGSVYMFPAQAVRDGLRCNVGGAVELCQKLREMGHRIWVDPLIPIVQPVELWESRGHARF